MWVWSLGWEDPRKEVMATHSSILTGIIPWTEWWATFCGVAKSLTQLKWLSTHPFSYIRYFFFSIAFNVINFPLHCFFCIPHNLINFILIFICSKYICFSWDFVFTMCCLMPKCFGIFQLSSVLDFWFNSTVVWEHTLYEMHSLKFFILCFMVHNVIYLGECNFLTSVSVHFW